MDKKFMKEIKKEVNKIKGIINNFKQADILFEGGIQKSGHVLITFDCVETLSTYILFSCMERNERGQLLLYAARFSPYLSIRWEFEYLDEMNDKEIEMIEDTIAEVSSKGVFYRRPSAILDKTLKVEKVVFK